jgi:hypothetical protein
MAVSILGRDVPTLERFGRALLDENLLFLKRPYAACEAERELLVSPILGATINHPDQVGMHTLKL